MSNQARDLQFWTKSRSELPLPANLNYRHDIQKFNAWLRENDLHFSQEAVIQYFSFIAQEGIKPRTIQRYKASLRQTIKESFGDRLTRLQNEKINLFFRAIKITDTRDEQGITHNNVLSSEELKRLINQSGRKTSLIIQALFETASRVSELCNIRLSDCKRSRDGMEIRIIGKGSKSRFVYMTYDLFSIIKKTYEGKTYLFEYKGKPMSRITAHTLIKRAGLKIGRQDLHPHMLRHTFATLNINRLGLPKVSKYLGHSSINVTTAFYLHGKPSLEDVLSNTRELLGEKHDKT